MNKNKGYTLIEMIIVIAIMAILAGVAAVAFNLISKAKVQDAVTSFNSQLSYSWLQTKATASKQKSMYAVIKGPAKDVGDSDFDRGGDCDYQFTLYDTDSAGAAVEESSTIFSAWAKYVTITYTPNPAGQAQTGYGTSKTGFYIQFDKSNGSVIKGAGTYEFKDAKGDVAATIYLDAATGHHYVK